METRYIEIRSAEGGMDAKLFSNDLTNAFKKFATQRNWKSELVESGNPIVLKIQSKNKDIHILDNASGGYRVQRVPPTEKKGRVHTSTVTVAILSSPPKSKIVFNDIDFSIEWFSGTGKGGQKKNKVKSSCKVKHIPTGIVETRQGRHREVNKSSAIEALKLRVLDNDNKSLAEDFSHIRKNKIGTGMRGDKIITLRQQDDFVTNHLNGKTTTFKKFMKGQLDIICDK